MLVHLIEKILKAAETLEKSKTGTASGLQTAIAMVEVRAHILFHALLRFTSSGASRPW